MKTPRPLRFHLEELEGRTLPAASLVADINPGAPSSNPDLDPYLVEEANVNGMLFFSAKDGTHGYELWKSDGTASGTVLVKDIHPGSSGSYPQQFVNVNGELYFRADDGVHTSELWKSNGTAAGTVLVHQGTDFSLPKYLTNVNGTLFFTAHGADGGELWKSDGTSAGTVRVKDLNPGGFSNTRYLTNVNGTLFFRATDGVHGYELWKSNGTTAGTVLVKDINPGFSSAYPGHLANVNGTLFFSANDGTHGEELWKSDGTGAGTVLVKDLNTGANGSTPSPLTNVNGTVFFGAADSTGSRVLWKSDGTAAGTVVVKNVSPGFGVMANLNGEVFFEAASGLWKSDGTTAGTISVMDGIAPTEITNVKGRLFFGASEIMHGKELWQSDGTTNGTVLVSDINPGYPDSDPASLINVNGMLFFSANDGTHGEELWAAAVDVSGARITSAVFSGTATDTFDTVRLTFSEPIDADTFTTGQVALNGPGGIITPLAVTPVPGSMTQFDVTFTVQNTQGIYTVTTGVSMLDLAGNPMNQNQNSVNGEFPGDQFTGTGVLGTPPIPPFFAVGNVGGSVRIVNASTGAVISTIRPLDNGGTQYTGLVEVALGDFNSDSVPDLAVSAADPAGLDGLTTSKAGKVFVYDGADLITGIVPTSPFRSFTPFATTSGPGGTSGAFTNGLNIAVGDVNGDGTVDLIAGTRGATGSVGRAEYGRLVVIDGSSPVGSNTIIGGIQTPFGPGYQKGVVVAAGNVDGVGGDEIAVTRGGPVASTDPNIQKIKVKVLQLQGSVLTELPLNADGSTSFAPFGALSGPANAIKRDGRVAFVDENGDGKAELVFTALDPLTNSSNEQVRVGVYSINPAASTGAATIVSTGPDAGTYRTGSAVVDHAITHVAGTGAAENLALLAESSSSGIVYLDPLTGAVQTGGFALSVLHGGITIDGD